MRISSFRPVSWPGSDRALSLEQLRERVDACQSELDSHQPHLARAEKLKTWSWRLGPAATGLGLAGLGMGMTTAGAGLGLAGLVVCLGVPLARARLSQRQELAHASQLRLRVARQEYEACCGALPARPEDAVKQLATGLQAQGGAILESQGSLVVGGVRLRTRA